MRKRFIILKTLYNRLIITVKLIKNGNLKPILDGFTTRLYSKIKFIGLEAKPDELSVKNSKIEILIRPFETSDLNALKEGHRHVRLVEAQIPNCYVATTKENVTIYRQWLFTHESQQQINDYFGPIFPIISENEAIIEGVFTHPDYRGLNIMSSAMTKILEQEQYKNLNKVIAFVKEQNKPSLKGFYKMGFVPYIIRQEAWFLFRRKVTFVQMSDKLREKYLKSLS